MNARIRNGKFDFGNKWRRELLQTGNYQNSPPQNRKLRHFHEISTFNDYPERENIFKSPLTLHLRIENYFPHVFESALFILSDLMAVCSLLFSLLVDFFLFFFFFNMKDFCIPDKNAKREMRNSDSRQQKFWCRESKFHSKGSQQNKIRSLEANFVPKNVGLNTIN